VAGDENDAAYLACEYEPAGELPPEVASARILERLIAAAEAVAGVRIERGVVSVPAYFNEEQCSATIAAGSGPPGPAALKALFLVSVVCWHARTLSVASGPMCVYGCLGPCACHFRVSMLSSAAPPSLPELLVHLPPKKMELACAGG
jgi:hypothetical protein